MASYRADIEIGVRGARNLEQLRSSINQTARAVDSLNDVVSARGSLVQSIQNYTNNLNRAARSLQLVGAGTEAETKAVREYVQALGAANAARARQNSLVAQELANQRRVTPGNAGYGQQGPALPPALVRAQQVQQNWNRFFQEAAEVAQELQINAAAKTTNLKTNWNRFFQEAAEVAQELQINAAAKTTNLKTNWNRFFQEAAEVAQELQTTAASKAINIRSSWNTFFQEAQELAVELAAQTQQAAARIRRIEGSASAAARQRLADESARRARVENAGFGIQGPALPKQGTQNKGRGSEALSNAIIGGAFPLLFGQGVGSAIGGGLGGAVGGLLGGQFGFGLSLVGTAVGQTFDNASQSAGDFAKALKDTGDASDALETALGSLDKDTKTLIQNLAQSGQTAAAAEASFEALAQRIGVDQAEALKRAGEAANEWGTTFQTWLTKTYANVILLGEAIRNNFPTGPGIQGPSSVFDLVEGQAPQTLSKEAQARIEDLAGQNSLLEKQVDLARLTADASIDQRLQLERQIALQEYVNEATELERQLKEQSLAPQEHALRLKAAELRLTQQIYDLENAAQQARQRKAEEDRRAAEKAQREAERAAEKQLQIFNNIRGLQVSLIQQSLESADVDVERTRAVTGEIAAAKELLNQQQARLNLEARILDIQLEKALSAKDITEQERTLYESIYKQQKANLEAQYNTKYRMQQLDLARLQTARQIAFAEGDRALQDVRQQRGTQLAGLQAQLAFPFGGEGLDAANQALDQAARRYETLTPLQRELQNLETQRVNESAAMSAEELQLLNQNITKKTQQIDLEVAYLNQLDATEQALLRQQQVYERYGFIADEISRALSDSITGLITGTTTVAEAFSRMFENIGKAFVDMATQMLAQKLVFSLLQGLLGGVGGSGFSFGGAGPVSGASVFGAGQAGFNPSAFTGGFSFRADGGPVSSNTPYIVGERGPELFVPSSSGSVMSNADTRAALAEQTAARSTNDTRAMLEQQTAARQANATGMALQQKPIDVRYESTIINQTEYVSAEQHRKGMAEAAERGRTLALSALQNSVKTRKRVGI